MVEDLDAQVGTSSEPVEQGQQEGPAMGQAPQHVILPPGVRQRLQAYNAQMQAIQGRLSEIVAVALEGMGITGQPVSVDPNTGVVTFQGAAPADSPQVVPTPINRAARRKQARKN